VAFDPSALSADLALRDRGVLQLGLKGQVRGCCGAKPPAAGSAVSLATSCSVWRPQASQVRPRLQLVAVLLLRHFACSWCLI
jgi:hypothetical protein